MGYWWDGHPEEPYWCEINRVTDDLVKREAARVYAQRNRVPGAASSSEKERREGA